VSPYHEPMRRLLAVSLIALAVPVVVQAAANPVVVASKRTAAATSVTFQMAMTSTVAGQRSSVTGSGAIKGTSARLSMRLRAQAMTARIDAILLQEAGKYVMYMRSPVFQSQLPRGKSWVRLDLSKHSADLGVDFTSLINASQTFAPLEHGLVSTTQKGRVVIAGAPTTRYRVVVDVERAARAVPTFGRQVLAIQRATGIRLGRLPYDVWIGSDRRIRRMSFTMPAPGAGKTVQTMTFLAFDEPVTIAAPPRSQVVTR
jgi:hypothetical protein